MSPSGARGFTLLELLVAVMVLGLLLVLTQQGVAFGLRASATQVRLDNRQGDLETVDRSLRALLRAANPGTFPDPATLKGTAHTIGTVTMVPLASGRTPADVLLLQSGDALRLRWAPHRHVQPFGAQPPAEELLLLSGVASLDIAYFDGAAWQDRWSGDRLPLLVRLRIGFSDPSRHWPPIIVAPILDPIEQ